MLCPATVTFLYAQVPALTPNAPSSSPPTPAPELNIATALTVEHIIPSLRAEDGPGVIAEMLEKLEALGSIPKDSRGLLLAGLLEKEHRGSTGIGSGVAIPHIYSSTVSETVYVFGRSAQGVDFQSPDGEPVHFFLLYIVPEDRHMLHLQTLRSVAKNFTSTKLRQQLLTAPDAAHILEVFIKHNAS